MKALTMIALIAVLPTCATAAEPAGEVVGAMGVELNGTPADFDVIGGARTGTVWSDGQYGPVVNLMGTATDGSGNHFKVRFTVDRSTNELVCDPMDTVLEYWVDRRIYRMNPGEDCSRVHLDEVRHDDDAITVSGAFAGRFERHNAGDETAYDAKNGHFEATVEPFRR